MNRQTTRWLRSVFTTAALASLFATTAHAQDPLWIRQFGTSDSDCAAALAPDGVGGAFVAGYTGGNRGGPNAVLYDLFLARYDDAGNRLWIRHFGAPQVNPSGGALAPDGTGGVFVGGRTEEGLGWPNGGYWDAILARYDDAGNQLWFRQFGANGENTIRALASDGAGGVIVAGETQGSLGGPTAGGYDTFLARYDENGNRLWIRQFGTSDYEYASALAPDGAGGFWVAGATRGSLAGPNAGGYDAFLARHDESGNQTWIRQFGTSGGDGIGALAPDGAGGVMVAGGTEGNLGGPNAGGGDAFLARYDSAGNQRWIQQFGTSGHDGISALVLDGAGGMMVAGRAGGDLGAPIPDPGAFLGRYTSAGERLWIRQFGGDNARALAPDGAGGVMVAGSTSRSLSGPIVGWPDAYVARFGDFNCYHADCDQSTGIGVLDMLDFLCFQTAFMNGEEFACDCDTSTGNGAGNGVCDIFDFLCFQNAFVAGCP